jgi:hypothetical protein
MHRMLVIAIVAAAPLPALADGPPGDAPPVDGAGAVDDDPCRDHAGSAWRTHRPRIAIGFAKSHLELDGDREGRQKSLLARVAFRRGLEVELELSRADLDGEEAKTIGGAVLKAFGHRRLAPYVIAGGGGGVLERDDGSEPRLRYGEVGGGVMLRKRRFAIGVDVRAGVRKVEARDVDVADPPVATRLAAPAPSPEPDADDKDHYVRGRIVALFYF